MPFDCWRPNTHQGNRVNPTQQPTARIFLSFPSKILLQMRIFPNTFIAPFAITLLVCAASFSDTRSAVAQSPSRDASIASITVNSQPVIRLGEDIGVITANIAQDLERASVVVTPNHPGASVTYRAVDLDLDVPGVQFDVAPGTAYGFTFEVTAEDRIEKQHRFVRIGRGTDEAFKWKSDDDFHNLFGGGQYRTRGIWSDGTTMWVGNRYSRRIQAFRMSDKVAVPERDINYVSGSGSLRGLWSDGTTMWGSDLFARRVFAYHIDNNQPDPQKDLVMADENREPSGVWSNGETMWISDTNVGKLFAYRLFDGRYTPERDVELALGNFAPDEIWSDGETMWVADHRLPKLFAYRIDDWSRVPNYDFDLTFENGFEHRDFPAGIWSDGQTMWVSSPADANIYSYNMPDSGDTLGRDATLASITVGPKNITVFAPDVDRYSVGVAHDTETATISAIPNDGDATVHINGEPIATGATYRHPLESGKNPVTITVSAAEGVTTKTYSVVIGRGVNDAFGWKASDDFNGFHEDGNRSAGGLWSDGNTMWVTSAIQSMLFAFRVSDKQRVPELDFDLRSNGVIPYSIWSDGETLWIGRSNSGEIYAYRISDGQRKSSLDIKLTEENTSAAGLWSDGDTMFVSDYFDGKLYAYDMADNRPRPEKDFRLTDVNAAPGGIWSNGQIWWISDGDDNKIYAYRVSDGKRVPGLDFEVFVRHNELLATYAPYGIWSDGDTMWMVDEGGTKIFSYNMPTLGTVGDSDASLRELEVNPKDITGFDPDLKIYAVGLGNQVTQATIIPTSNAPGATIDIDGTVVQSGVAHPISLAEDVNEINITVTAADGINVEIYTLDITRSVNKPLGRAAHKDFDTLFAAGNKNSAGIWSDGTTMWVADPDDRKIYAYRMSDAMRDPANDFNLDNRIGHSTGIWSDGETIWFADDKGTKLNAYRMSDKRRDSTNDFRPRSR